MELSSLKNPRVREVLNLRTRRERDRQELMIVEGTRELTLALRHGIGIRTVFLCRERASEDELRLCEEARIRGAEVITVTEAVAEKLGYGERGAGCVAVAQMPSRSLSTVEASLSEHPLLLVLDGFEKPGNLGAAFRVADGAGIDGILICGEGTDPHNPNAIRASLGTIFSVPHAVLPAWDAVRWCRDRGMIIVAATPQSEQLYWDVDYRGGCAIVAGSEHRGIGRDWLEAADVRVGIPMRGEADSLNAAASTGILVYEALRQRSSRAICASG